MSYNNIIIEDIRRFIQAAGNDVNTELLNDACNYFAELNNPFDADNLFFEKAKSALSAHGLKKDDLIIGPNLQLLQDATELSAKNLPDQALANILDQYKQQFIPNRELKLFGIDLDDCVYNNEPVKGELIRRIGNILGEFLERIPANDIYDICKVPSTPKNVRREALQAILTSKGGLEQTGAITILENIINQYNDFMAFKDDAINDFYTPYDGALETLKSLMGCEAYIVEIITNGESLAQREKLRVLGLKEGVHYNQVLVSEDVKAKKPSKEIYEEALKIANMNGDSILPCQCLMMEDRVENLPGAFNWLKAQFLRGRHSKKLPLTAGEIPKYGISDFKLLAAIPALENDSHIQKEASPIFVYKSIALAGLLWG